MLPLLDLIAHTKREEAATEAPFAGLLAAQIAAQHRVPLDDAIAAVPALVAWWKLKNRTHRTLLADEKALRMILPEYGRRHHAQQQRHRLAHVLPAIIDHIAALHPDALLIAHKNDGDFACLAPANAENVYLHEHTWTWSETADRLTAHPSRLWTLPDYRAAGWSTLRQSDRWAAWDRTARAADHLTDPEQESFVRELRAHLARQHPDALPLLVATGSYWSRRRALTIYYVPAPHTWERPRAGALRSQAPPYPTIHQIAVSWARGSNGIAALDLAGANDFDSRHNFREAEWRRDRPNHRIPWSDQDALDRLEACHPAYEALHKEVAAFHSGVHFMMQSLIDRARARDEADAYQRFLQDYGDPSLWDGHKKTLRFPRYDDSACRALFTYLLERDVSLNTLTVDDALQLATRLGFKLSHHAAIDATLRALPCRAAPESAS